MKNGNLFVKNYAIPASYVNGPSYSVKLVQQGPAKDIDFTRFKTPAQMGDWEFAAYHAYGDDDKCVRDGIDTLADLFGTQFSKQFYRYKDRLQARQSLPGLLKELAILKRTVASYKKRAR